APPSAPGWSAPTEYALGCQPSLPPPRRPRAPPGSQATEVRPVAARAQVVVVRPQEMGPAARLREPDHEPSSPDPVPARRPPWAWAPPALAHCRPAPRLRSEYVE